MEYYIILRNLQMKKDFFGFETQGAKYEQFRPKYPHHFLTKTLNRVPLKNRYLDIATGTGQVLFQIAHHFNEAKGIDISKKMVSICEQKLKLMNKTNISVQKVDLMKFQNDKKYNLITIGEALHWFPVRHSLKKVRNMLEDDGLFTVYGYIVKGIRNYDGKERRDYNQMYENFYDKKIKNHFEYDCDELYNHQSETDKYPFHKFFKIERYSEYVASRMKKEVFLSYLRTYSGYNTYLQKFKDDPLKQMQEHIKEEEISCVFDYFMISCEKL